MFALIGMTLTFIAGIVMYSSMAEIKPMEYIIYAAIGLIAIFAIVSVSKNLKAEKKGFTTEDELSRKIKLKAGASAFTVSFYLWAMILLLTIDNDVSNELILGCGIAGMGFIFIAFWFYHNKTGIDEN